MGLVEVLDWTAVALDRVERDAFFDKFSEGEAVQYFYEPFLKAFDPALRKQLGVWYTPAEVVRYMVARVDRALKDDLGIADGTGGGGERLRARSMLRHGCIPRRGAASHSRQSRQDAASVRSDRSARQGGRN